jgi:lysozyme
MNVREMLRREEGNALKAYPDPVSHGDPWTIGVAHTGPEVVEGLVWTQAQADATFEVDVDHAEAECRGAFPWFDQLNEARQAVLIGMVFQMGLGHAPHAGAEGTGLLGFPKALAAIHDQRWHDALGQLLDSRWAKQTPARALRMARQMETGEWQLALPRAAAAPAPTSTTSSGAHA